MSNLKKFFRNKKLVSSALSCLAMLVAFVVLSISLFGGTKAWFAKNKDVGANGMTFATKDDFLSFADTFTAKAIMNHAEIASGTYLRADDGGYYLVGDDGNFALDESGNKRPLSYGSLYPGEYIEVSLKIRCAESRIGTGYRLYFSDLEKSDDHCHQGSSTCPDGCKSKRYDLSNETYGKYDKPGCNLPIHIEHLPRLGNPGMR